MDFPLVFEYSANFDGRKALERNLNKWCKIQNSGKKSFHKWWLARNRYSENIPSHHGCISDPSLRCLMQCLRDISKTAYLQISETSSLRFSKGVSSHTSMRSLRSSQSHLWVAFETRILWIQTATFFGNLFI